MAFFRCASCGAMNRVADDRVREHPVCGGCKAKLDANGGPQAVSGDAFDRAIAASPVPVLVDFWAEWCGPCRMAAPVVAELGRRQAGKVLVLKVNVDEDQRAADRWRIRGIPAFVLFQGGQEVARRAGLSSLTDLEAWVAKGAKAAA